jgi:hypothetical protein
VSGRRAERTVDIRRPAAEVFEALVRLLPGLKGMRIERADAEAGKILAKVGFSLASYGENVTLSVTARPDGGSRLAVVSSLRWGLVDWGKNRTNIERILQGLDGTLAAGAWPARSPPVPPPPEA